MIMKLLATPLLDDKETTVASIEVDLEPRRFVDLLDRQKAVLLQSTNSTEGCPLTPDDFGQIVVDLQLTRYPYVGGAAPRTIIPVKASKDDIVFTANER